MNYYDNTDEQLCALENGFDFLYYITPANHVESWLSFEENGRQKVPEIKYRPKPSLRELKEQAKRLQREIEGPEILRNIYKAKIDETLAMISLVESIGQSQFKELSIQLFGQPDPQLLSTAKSILEKVDSNVGHEQNVHAPQLKEVFDSKIDEYAETHPYFTPEVIVREDIDSMLVSRTKLFIGAGFSTSLQRAHALCAHEVGTHLVTHFNGLRQPVKLFAYGLAGYDELQEGIAVLSEYLVAGLSKHRMRILAGRIIAVDAMLHGCSFMELFNLLHSYYEFAALDAFEMCSRVFRGGAFTKDTIYLRGILRVKEMLQNGSPLLPLYLGKISFMEAENIDEMQKAELSVNPSITPHFVQNESFKQRLNALPAKSIEELID